MFVVFPVELSWQECRDRMELMILDAVEVFDPDMEREPEITPYWVFLALSNEMRKEIRRMSAKERRDALAAAWADREERVRRMLGKGKQTETTA